MNISKPESWPRAVWFECLIRPNCTNFIAVQAHTEPEAPPCKAPTITASLAVRSMTMFRVSLRTWSTAARARAGTASSAYGGKRVTRQTRNLQQLLLSSPSLQALRTKTSIITDSGSLNKQSALDLRYHPKAQWSFRIEDAGRRASG